MERNGNKRWTGSSTLLHSFARRSNSLNGMLGSVDASAAGAGAGAGAAVETTDCLRGCAVRVGTS